MVALPFFFLLPMYRVCGRMLLQRGVQSAHCFTDSLQFARMLLSGRTDGPGGAQLLAFTLACIVWVNTLWLN